MEPEHIAYLPFISLMLDQPLVVDNDIELDVRDTSMGTVFSKGKSDGLFTLKRIPKGTIIMVVGDESKINDGIVDLGPILRAATNIEMYQELTNLRKSYYDMEKMKRIINVRMVCDGNKFYYQAITDIDANSELLRVYGFTSWVFEIFGIIDDRTIGGYVKFVKELSENIKGDPLEKRIRKMVDMFNLRFLD
jgi:hypothetical protein